MHFHSSRLLQTNVRIGIPDVADLHAFNILCHWFKAYDPAKFTDEYPRLDEYIHRVAAIPLVSDYIRRAQEPTIWFHLPDIALRMTTPEELDGLTLTG